MKKKIVIRRAEVFWDDSLQDNQVWWHPEEWITERKKSKECFKSTGYVFHKNKKNLVMATSIHYDENGEIQKVGTVFSIPTGCITKIKWL